MSILFDAYKDICQYPLRERVQKLDLSIDYPQIRDEVLNLIADNNYGYNPVSLRLPPGETNWTNPKEDLISTADGVLKFGTPKQTNRADNKLYTDWHANTEYTQELGKQLEQHTGLNIGRVRLAWLPTNFAYPMHIDFEAIRFHIPIVSNKYTYFINGSELSQMPEGHAYHIITDEIHTAMNYGGFPRLHLVYSTYTTPEIDQAIEQSVTKLTADDTFINHVKYDKDTLLKLIKIAYRDNRSDSEKFLKLMKINTNNGKA
jgi:hypothetical protein